MGAGLGLGLGAGADDVVGAGFGFGGVDVSGAGADDVVGAGASLVRGADVVGSGTPLPVSPWISALSGSFSFGVTLSFE